MSAWAVARGCSSRVVAWVPFWDEQKHFASRCAPPRCRLEPQSARRARSGLGWRLRSVQLEEFAAFMFKTRQLGTQRRQEPRPLTGRGARRQRSDDSAVHPGTEGLFPKIGYEGWQGPSAAELRERVQPYCTLRSCRRRRQTWVRLWRALPEMKSSGTRGMVAALLIVNKSCTNWSYMQHAQERCTVQEFPTRVCVMMPLIATPGSAIPLLCIVSFVCIHTWQVPLS